MSTLWIKYQRHTFVVIFKKTLQYNVINTNNRLKFKSINTRVELNAGIFDLISSYLTDVDLTVSTVYICSI